MQLQGLWVPLLASRLLLQGRKEGRERERERERRKEGRGEGRGEGRRPVYQGRE
jgi:hypothetical protein